MINSEQTKAHIELLHKQANGLEGKFVLSSFGEGLKPIIQHFQIGDVDNMASSAIGLANQTGRNVHISPALMRSDLPSNLKGNESDVVAVLGYVADFDKGRGADYENRCPLKPSYVLETSPNNAQCFFLPDEPIIIKNDNDRAEAKDLAIKLTHNCDGADFGGVDISHVWRIAGLPNYPNQKKIAEGRSTTPFTVRIMEAFNG